MATSRTHYFVSQNPTNRAIEHISSPDFKRLVNSAGRKNAEERSSPSSKINCVSSSESSSNLQYETSSEGFPQQIEDLMSQPINTIRNIDQRHCAGTLEFGGQIAGSEFNHVDEANTSIRESVSIVDSIKRSESLPFVRHNGPRRTNDPIDRRRDDTLDRLPSESSPARITKFKTIVNRVESIGWPRYDVSLSGQATSKDVFAGPDETQTITPCFIPAVQRPYEFFNNNKAVTLFSMRDNGKPFEMSEKRTKLVSRIRSSHRADLVTLSRIENELVPLQNEFSKLTGELRALDLTGLPPYNICGDPWIDATGGSSILSEHVSGYSLHRTKIFCRNDSHPMLTMVRRSRSIVLPLPAVDKPAALRTAETSTVLKSCGIPQGSRVRHDGVRVDYRRSQNVPRNSVKTSRTFCGNSRHHGNNEVPFFNEKPFGYGFRCDFTVGRNDYADKPICFGITKGQSEQDHLSRCGSSERCFLLPLASNSHFCNTFSQISHSSQNDMKARAMSKQYRTIVSNGIDPPHRCKELQDCDFCLTDDTIWMAHRNSDNLAVAGACSDNFCANREHSISRRMPDGSVSITGIYSDRSAASISSGDDVSMTKNLHYKMQKTLSGRISNLAEVKFQTEDETPEKSIVLTAKLENARMFECDRSKHTTKYLSTDILISQSVDGTIDSPNNVGSLDTEKKTSLRNCLPVSRPGSENLQIHKLDNSPVSDNQFTGTYTERMISIKNSASPKVTNISGQKAFSFNGMSVYRCGLETMEIAENCGEDVISYRDGEKRLSLPIGDEKITIVPVMYAPGISKTVHKYNEISRRHKNIKIRSDRYRSTLEQMPHRAKKSSARKSSMLSRDGSVALAYLASHLSHLRDKDVSFFANEKSVLDQSRTERRLSFSYGRSNSSVSVSSSFATERYETRSQMIPKAKRKLFCPDNRSLFRRSSNCDSARRRSNEEIIGITTSPDDFLDNV